MQLYPFNFFLFLLCYLWYNCPNSMDSQRLTGSVLVVQVKTLLNLYNEKIVLENSGIK